MARSGAGRFNFEGLTFVSNFSFSGFSIPSDGCSGWSPRLPAAGPLPIQHGVGEGELPGG